MIVHIGDITLNNDVADGNGSKWYVTEMEGWDSPDVRAGTLELPGQHGEVPVEGTYTARHIVVKGLCKAISASAFYASWYYLASQTNYLGRRTFMFSVEEDIRRQCAVSRAGKLHMQHVGVGAFTFDVMLRADDPRKYDYTEQSEPFNAATPETLTNDGIAATYPRITLNGTGSPVISIGDLTWTASASIPSGTVIDMKAQTVLNAGTSYFDSVDLSSEWPWLEPGPNTVESSVPMTVAWRDAWL